MNVRADSPSRPPPSPVIGPVAFRELRAVARIQRASFRSRLAYGAVALAILRVFPGVAFLVARTPAGAVIGCAIGDRYRGDLRVMNIAVAPDHRRQGIGRALLHALADAIPDGDIVLMVEEWNTGAQDLYSSEGFRKAGYLKDYYGRDRHGIRMRKSRSDAANRSTLVA